MFCVTHLFRALDFPTCPYSLRLSVRPSFSDILHNNFQGVIFRPGAGQRLVNVTMTALTKKSDSVFRPSDSLSRETSRGLGRAHLQCRVFSQEHCNVKLHHRHAEPLEPLGARQL